MLGSGTTLITKALRHPGRAVLRSLLMARLWRRGERIESARFAEWLSQELGVDAMPLRFQYATSPFHRWNAARLRELGALGGPIRLGTSGPFTQELLYVLVRALRPQIVVETGVLYGGSSAHILAGLNDNEQGELHSIELGTCPQEPPCDFLVPELLRHRWHLVLGDSRRELPALLSHLPLIDLFHHDSLHTFEHMTQEFETVLPRLAADGVLSSHDVLIAHSLGRIFGKNAFRVFCDRHCLRYSTFRNCGCAVRQERGPHQAGANFWDAAAHPKATDNYAVRMHARGQPSAELVPTRCMSGRINRDG
jgi:predicted O-methyltransferase YrrM